MPPDPAAKPLWYLIPARVLVVTLLLTLLSFAVSLLLGILGLVVAGGMQGGHPDLAVAYRRIALPVAAVVASLAFISMTVLEIRTFRRNKALAEIARASR